MFRFFKYIMLFILGYKVIKMLFAEDKPQHNVTPPPQRQNIKNTPPNTATTSSKFSAAEVIDYEEVK